uniref:hypothetical protein n=1 Tax=Alistipes putredinis TaxID=28117 RepID=UPI003FD72925
PPDGSRSLFSAFLNLPYLYSVFNIIISVKNHTRIHVPLSALSEALLHLPVVKIKRVRTVANP